MRSIMVLSLAATLLTAVNASAAPVSYLGGTYTQSFDGLPTTGSQTLSGLGPHDIEGVLGGTGVPGWTMTNNGGTSPDTEYCEHNFAVNMRWPSQEPATPGSTVREQRYPSRSRCWAVVPKKSDLRPPVPLTQMAFSRSLKRECARWEINLQPVVFQETCAKKNLVASRKK